MQAGLIFCIGAVKHGTPTEKKNKELPEQAKFNKKDTVICHFCKRLMWLPYPHTENFKQWNVKEVHEVLKCHYFDKDLIR